MRDYNKEIGEYLAKARIDRGLTQQQVADRLGVTKTCVHYWESGKRTIYASNMIEYCLAIGLDPQDIVRDVTGGR